ncbi:MAG TPA: hypothetical protein VIM11_08390, partial [Tepidisphaeraceae bacterium]
MGNSFVRRWVVALSIGMCTFGSYAFAQNAPPQSTAPQTPERPGLSPDASVTGRKRIVFVTGKPSALSHNDFRVDRLQLDPRAADLELPIDSPLFGVAVLMPSGGFLSQT